MAQFVRLAHSIDAGRPVETPSVLRERYIETERPGGPELQVSTRFVGDSLVVAAETDEAVVAVKTPSETALVDPVEGSFETSLDIEHGENQITVAAASDEELRSAGTSVTRFTL
jgi:hypothetical protein